jgi:hypothetical protein
MKQSGPVPESRWGANAEYVFCDRRFDRFVIYSNSRIDVHRNPSTQLTQASASGNLVASKRGMAILE